MLTYKQKLTKRIFDVSISIVILPFAIIPLILLLIISRITIGSNSLFSQVRIGENGKPFKLYKIRTLKGSNHLTINEIKKSETSFGGWLRNTKLDELPQLINVLKGEMSLVGPRPDIVGYADKLEGDDRLVLTVKPGITGPATLKYKNEDVLLLQQENPLWYNDTVVWPDKVAINKKYINEWSLQKDIKYLFASLVN